MPLRSIIFIAVFIVISMISGKELIDISNTWSVVASAVNIITIAALILLTKNDGGFKKLINYEKGKTTPKQVVGMSVLIICLGMGGMYLAGFLCYGIIPYAPPMMIAPIPVPLAVINLILLPVSTALSENSIYLGCGVNTIKNRYLSVILPAFFFVPAASLPGGGPPPVPEQGSCSASRPQVAQISRCPSLSFPPVKSP